MATRGWDNHGFLNVEGAHLGPIGTRVMAMNEW